MITLSNKQARQFLLLKHGLLGEYRFVGKQGSLEYIRQAGCIQYDPVDSCGKNPELVMQSRVKHFTKKILNELLYMDRKLFDYPDKNLSIIPTEDWPYFVRYRKAAQEGGLRIEGLKELEDQAKHYINNKGPVCSNELPLSGSLRWKSSIHWSGGWNGDTNAARAVLEQLYSTGELVIHHKNGTRKYYDLAEKYISAELVNSPDPLPDDFEHQEWRVFRRIGAVGLLWNRPSDAWLNIWGLNSQRRGEIFHKLRNENKIMDVEVDGLKDLLYCHMEDMALIDSIRQDKSIRPRCELIAPLDCLLWDRKLIKALFNFDYTWEIYTPADKRRYGFYVLPLLYGGNFAGRVEAVNDRKAKTLIVKNIWYEDGVRHTKMLQTAIDACLKRFAEFNNCDVIEKN